MQRLKALLLFLSTGMQERIPMCSFTVNLFDRIGRGLRTWYTTYQGSAVSQLLLPTLNYSAEIAEWMNNWLPDDAPSALRCLLTNMQMQSSLAAVWVDAILEYSWLPLSDCEYQTTCLLNRWICQSDSLRSHVVLEEQLPCLPASELL